MGVTEIQANPNIIPICSYAFHEPPCYLDPDQPGALGEQRIHRLDGKPEKIAFVKFIFISKLIEKPQEVVRSTLTLFLVFGNSEAAVAWFRVSVNRPKKTRGATWQRYS